MSFQMFKRVDDLDDPEGVEKFTVDEVSEFSEGLMESAAKMFLSNRLVQNALKEVEVFKRTKTLMGTNPIRTPNSQSVIICSAMEDRLLKLNDQGIPADRVWSTGDVRMDNKAIVLQLEHFEPVVVYSLSKSDKFSSQKELKYRFNLKALHGVLYERDQESLEKALGWATPT